MQHVKKFKQSRLGNCKTFCPLKSIIKGIFFLAETLMQSEWGIIFTCTHAPPRMILHASDGRILLRSEHDHAQILAVIVPQCVLRMA